MSFQASSILWALFAVSIPVIIHLLNRRRHRTVKWAAMSFILKATRESRGKKKLKHIIILTCRTLALAGLIFAVAQPLVGGWFGWGSTKLDTVILVLDRSASMENETGVDRDSKRERVIAQVKETFNQLGSTPNLVLIDSASGEIQQIASIDALDSLSTTAATDTKADIPNLLDKATSHIMANSNTGKTEIWVASDLQDSNWNSKSSRWESVRASLENLQVKPKVRVIALTGTPNADNNNLAAQIKTITRRNNKLIIDFNIARYDASRKNESVRVTFTINGAPQSREFKLSGQDTPLRHTITLPANSDDGYGHISLPSDANKRDNVAYFAYGKDVPSHTIVVTEGGEPEKYLPLFTLSGVGGRSVDVLPPHRFDSTKIDDTSLIIWHAPLPTDNDLTALTQYVDEGGSIIFFPSKTDSTEEFLGISWEDIQQSKRGEYFIISKWNELDGVLRNYSNGDVIPMDQLNAIKRRKIKGDYDAALAEWDDKSIAVAKKFHGKGVALFVSTLPDRTWSNIEYGDISIPLVQRSLRKGNARFGSKYFSLTGRNTPLAKQADDMVNLVNSTQVNAKYYPDEEAPNSAPIYLAGIKRVKENLVAMNRPEGEDDWAKVEDGALEKMFEGAEFSLFEDTGEDKKTPNPAWQYFLIAALLFLIIEAILCLQKKAAQRRVAATTPSKI